LLLGAILTFTPSAAVALSPRYRFDRIVDTSHSFFTGRSESEQKQQAKDCDSKTKSSSSSSSSSSSPPHLSDENPDPAAIIRAIQTCSNTGILPFLR
jgi:hypothetical protein